MIKTKLTFLVKGILVPSCQFLFLVGKENENYFIRHGCMVKDHAERSVERIFQLKIFFGFNQRYAIDVPSGIFSFSFFTPIIV